MARARSERQFVDAIVEARASGWPWARAEKVLGTSVQAAPQRYGELVERA